jgi:hypothetical protein
VLASRQASGLMGFIKRGEGVMDGGTSLGRNRVAFEPPDTVFEVLYGDISGEDMSQVLEASKQWVETDTDIYFLVDLSNAGTISPEARNVIRTGRARPNIRGAALFGASFQMRVVSTFVTRALFLLDKISYEINYLDTEAQARAWLATLRKKHAREKR